ncbi:hypothetical protein ACFY05_26755 [Microtetraspora fusca]|uniref:Secreted protein n=1 Tax=Microtetraspora fusca TaxID=1997 RepID=A0ABW6VEC6_MICFU
MAFVRRTLCGLVAFLTVALGMGVLSSAANAAVDNCGSSAAYSGSAEGRIDNGILRAGFCIGAGKLRRINLEYEKNNGDTSTTVKLGYQRTDSSGVGISSPIYGTAQTVTKGHTISQSFSADDPVACYHGVMLNTLTGFQYVTKVWGSC